MDINFEKFLEIQKSKIKIDKNRLKFNSKSVSENEKEKLPAISKITRENTFNIEKLTKNERVHSPIIDFPQTSDLNTNYIDSIQLQSPNAILDLRSKDEDENHDNPFHLYNELMQNDSSGEKYSKYGEKSQQNNKEAVIEKQPEDLKQFHRYKHENNKDEMEQWVSDTFYSYFPSFNEAGKKREDLIRDRQIEYQNYLKQKTNVPPKNKKRTNEKLIEKPKNNIQKNDKSEIEIIVNNPNNNINDDNDGNLTRPGSTRHKLLQDLKHTDLSNLINTDDVQERNRVSAENELQKKMEYQKQLVRQIEEKRQEMEALRAKEKREEELLTKKLEEQLKTMQLEENLEKERLKTEKTRLANEQNHILRMQLLSKLENDHKLYNPYPERHTQSENGKDAIQTMNNNNNNNNKDDNNKVYKYFSNSARRQDKFERDKMFDFLQTQQNHIQIPFKEKELMENSNLDKQRCQHYQQNICNFCDIKLKTYENWCYQCKRNFHDDGLENNLLICENCQQQYFICKECDEKNSPCTFCHRKRNFCLDCIRNFCLQCGRCTPREHKPTPSTSYSDISTTKYSKPNSIRSFKVLDINYNESDNDFDVEDSNSIYTKSSNTNNNNHFTNKPPYSMNLNRNSIFHPDNRIIEPKLELKIKNGEVSIKNLNNNINEIKDNNNIEILKNDTNNRLARYLKNYGDLSSRNMKTIATQTVVIDSPDENKRKEPPSMPLLREPTVNKNFTHKKNLHRTESIQSNKMTTLSQKWEIPAVQRNIVSSGSPYVLTQLGAFRKQLQSEQMRDLEDELQK